jgi:hypothetical protein
MAAAVASWSIQTLLVQALCKTSRSGIKVPRESADTRNVAVASARPNVGDHAYVQADAQRALPHMRGVDGTVVAIEGEEALLRRSSGETLRVELSVLRLNRRRQRRPVSWEPA